MATLAWVLFALSIVWYFSSQRLNHRKRNNLERYIVYLLLADNIRNKHKQNFQEWIRQSNAPDAMALSLAATRAIDGMAEQLAAGDPSRPSSSSILGSHAMIWRFKQGDQIE